MAGYSPQPIPSFGGGLNIRDKADAVDPSQAIDLLNVTFTDRGAVEQRSGYDNLGSAHTNNIKSLSEFYTTGGTAQILAGCGTRLEAISTSGSVVASATGLTDGTHAFARFGSPNNERAYAGQGDDLLRRWDGAAWTSIADSPKAGALAVQGQPGSGLAPRLVAGRFNGTSGGPSSSTSSPSHVYFSDVGDPETWDSTNYIQVTPGDGEKVQAIVAWRDFVFIFKETKFFVVYGESVDSGGGPIFNYRTVAAGVGCVGPKAAVAGREGVYFVSRRGVYRTTGAEPQKVSELIDPFFDTSQVPSDFYLGGTQLQSQISNVALGYHNERLYLGATTTGTTNNRTLVYDPENQWWSLWDIPASALISFRVSSDPELIFGSVKTLFRHSQTYTNDNGDAIESRWRSGWFDYGLSSRKTIRESKAWGTGRVFYGISSNFASDTGSLVQLDMTNPAPTTWNVETWNTSTWADGTSVVLTPDEDRTSRRGEVFSVYFQNTTLDQEWSVHRLANHLRGPRRRATPVNT